MDWLAVTSPVHYESLVNYTLSATMISLSQSRAKRDSVTKRLMQPVSTFAAHTLKQSGAPRNSITKKLMLDGHDALTFILSGARRDLVSTCCTPVTPNVIVFLLSSAFFKVFCLTDLHHCHMEWFIITWHYSRFHVQLILLH